MVNIRRSLAHRLLRWPTLIDWLDWVMATDVCLVDEHMGGWIECQWCKFGKRQRPTMKK